MRWCYTVEGCSFAQAVISRTPNNRQINQYLILSKRSLHFYKIKTELKFSNKSDGVQPSLYYPLLQKTGGL